MQILPTLSSAQSITDSFLIGANLVANLGDSFAEELSRQQDARNAVANDESYSVEEALDSNTQVTPLNYAPYNLNSNDGVTYSPDEVLFTQEELRQLEDDLRNAGAPEDTLSELKKLAEQPDGSSLSEVRAALMSPREYPSLSMTEKQTLKSLTNKLDPSGGLYSDIRGFLDNRNGQGVLDALVNAMDNLNGGAATFSKQEMSVLSKALGLSAQSTQLTMESFGKGGALTLNKAGFAALLNPAQNEFSAERASQEKLKGALDKTINPLLQAAKERMEAEKSASDLATRTSGHKKVYIEKTVTETVNNNIEGTRSAQLNGQAQAGEQMNAELKAGTENMLADVNMKDAVKDISKDITKDNTKEGLATDLNGDKKLAQSKENTNNAFSGHDNKNNNQNNAWAQLFDKTTVRTENIATAKTSSTNITTPVIGIGGTHALSATQLAQNMANNQAQSQRAQLATQAASQVEKALLTAAKDGTKSLELQLHPAELGVLNITLTARNGEVSALIRSERSETAEVLHKQMEHIRAQLEEQGVKVDKIEVRQGGQENSASSEQWNQENKGHASREENAQRELMERLRNLGKVRNDNTNLNGTTLERNMQSNNMSAGNAAQSLYIVA